MKYYIQAFNQYVDFSGRATKSEYWYFVLFNILFAIAALVLDNVLGTTFTPRGGIGPIYMVYVLVAFLPGIAVAVRRLHDVGKSGAMILIAFVPFIGGIWLLFLLTSDSVTRPNEVDQIGQRESDLTEKVAEIVDSKTLKKNISIFVVGMLISTILWKVLPLISDDFYNTLTYKVFRTLSTAFWVTVPFLLTFSIRDKNKKTIAMIIAVLLLLNSLFSLVSVWLGTDLSSLF